MVANHLGKTGVATLSDSLRNSFRLYIKIILTITLKNKIKLKKIYFKKK